MRHRMGSLFIVLCCALLGSGCDSGQKSPEPQAEPQMESQPATQEAAPAEAGALMATSATTGGPENDEGVSHFQQGHWDVAQEHFEKALAANPELPEAHYNLALALDKLGNHGEATTHFKKALELAPDDPRIKDSGILQAHVGG